MKKLLYPPKPKRPEPPKWNTRMRVDQQKALDAFNAGAIDKLRIAMPGDGRSAKERVEARFGKLVFPHRN